MGRVVAHIGRTLSGKTSDAIREASTRCPAIAWGPRFAHGDWTRVSIDEWNDAIEDGAPYECAVWNGDGFDAVEYAWEISEDTGGYLEAVIIDEIHRLWMKDKERTANCVKLICGEGRHSSADWHVTTQRLVRLPQDFLSDASELRLHRLKTRYDRQLVADFDGDEDERDGFPAWTRDLELADVVSDPRMCHSYVSIDVATERLRYVPCLCRAGQPNRRR